MTSAIPVQWSSNWAIKQTGSWSRYEFFIYCGERYEDLIINQMYDIAYIHLFRERPLLWFSAWGSFLGTIWIWSTCYLSRNCRELFSLSQKRYFHLFENNSHFFPRRIKKTGSTLITIGIVIRPKIGLIWSFWTMAVLWGAVCKFII